MPHVDPLAEPGTAEGRVALQTTNVQLRGELAQATERVEKFRCLLLQAAGASPEVFASVAADPDPMLQEIKRTVKRPADDAGASVPQAEFDELEREFFAGLEREKEYQQRIAALNAPRGGGGTAEEFEELKRVAAEAVAALQKLDVEKDELTQQLAAAAGGVSPVKLTAEDVEFQVGQRVEEEVMAATLELQDQLEAALAEAAEAKLKLGEPRVAALPASSAGTEEAEWKRRAEKAEAELRIAGRLREGTVRDSAALRAEADQWRSRAAAAGCSDAREAMEAAGSPGERLRPALDRQQSMAAEAKADRAAAVDAYATAESMQAQLTKQESGAVAREAALRDRISSLERRVEAEERRAAAAEAAKAAADAARAAVLDEGRALEAIHSDQLAAAERREEQYRSRLGELRDAASAATRGDGVGEADFLATSGAAGLLDAAAFDEVWAAVELRFKMLIAALRDAEDAQAREKVLCDLLVGYESRVWHLGNEVKSIQTIVDLRIADERDRARRRSGELKSGIEILRMQLREAKLKPSC